ncbi:sensor histidine kinase [Verrucosispora sp. WMMD573]|uniref:sensor histidine kinase n=1 Tax=Verrucosispora sp. WMMD573 TaxID=3015149 RepID=UPI00248B37D3|nr:sensor histidine kinase [Verrucosispora sp. WMMD573]WBB55259.1 sensor histidine kinase [Verrucosispora sp. WMMD573]
MSRFVAYVALCRAMLLGRLALTLAAVGVGIRLVDDPWQAGGALLLVTVTTCVQVTVLGRWPSVIRWRLGFLAVDAFIMIAVLVVSQGQVAFFCYSAGFAALTGALLGIRALPLWIAVAGLGLAVATHLLRTGGPADSIAAPFVLAFPMMNIVCGYGAAVLTAALTRYLDASIAAVASAYHSAAASERARLARELHDSVAKTLRGVSFAAVALPTLLRRQPDLAEELANTVSVGADTAIREARELLTGLRRDPLDRPLAAHLRELCRDWTERTGIAMQLDAADVEEPTPAARYELSQITAEALENVARHAAATLVNVSLREREGHVELTISDDGVGFAPPGELTTLSTMGSFGIIGMTERAQAVGGTLRLDSHAGTGTRVVARVPLPAAAGVTTTPSSGWRP